MSGSVIDATFPVPDRFFAGGNHLTNGSLARLLNAGGGATTDPIALFVDQATGDDETGLGTEESPLASIVEAVSRYPRFMLHKSQIFAAPGTYECPSIVARMWGAPSEIVGWENGDLAQGTLLFSGSAQTGSSAIQIVLSGTHALDEFRTASIRVLSGAAASDVRSLNGNDGTGNADTTPSNPFSGVVVDGDLVEIWRTPVVLDIPAISNEEHILIEHCGSSGALGSNALDPNARFSLINVAFTGGPAGGVRLQMNHSRVEWFGVEVRDTKVNPTASFTGWLCGNSDSSNRVVGYSDLGSVGETSWLGWGYTRTTEEQMWSGDNTAFDGYVVGARMFVFRLSTAFLRGGSLRRNGSSGAVIASSQGNISLNGSFSPALPMDIQQAGSGPTIEVRADGFFIGFVFDAVSQAGAVLQARGTGVIQFSQFLVTGASATGFGHDASLGGRIEFVLGIPTITGGGGDHTVDGGTTTVTNADARWTAAGGRLTDDVSANGPDGSVIQRTL